MYPLPRLLDNKYVFIKQSRGLAGEEQPFSCSKGIEADTHCPYQSAASSTAKEGTRIKDCHTREAELFTFSRPVLPPTETVTIGLGSILHSSLNSYCCNPGWYCPGRCSRKIYRVGISVFQHIEASICMLLPAHLVSLLIRADLSQNSSPSLLCSPSLISFSSITAKYHIGSRRCLTSFSLSHSYPFL